MFRARSLLSTFTTAFLYTPPRQLLQRTYLRGIATSRTMSTLPRLPIFQAIANHDPQSTVVIHSASGRRFTYGELLSDVAAGKEKLLKDGGGEKGVQGQRIAFLVENSYDYVGAHNGSASIWRISIDVFSDSPFYPRGTFDSPPSLAGVSCERVAVYCGSESGFAAVDFCEV